MAWPFDDDEEDPTPQVQDDYGDDPISIGQRAARDTLRLFSPKEDDGGLAAAVAKAAIKGVYGTTIEPAMKVAGAMKSGVDAAARWGVGLQGLKADGDATAGSILRDALYPADPARGGLADYVYKPQDPASVGGIVAAGLKPMLAAAPRDRGIARSVIGGVGQFGADMATDPLTYVGVPGLAQPKAARAGAKILAGQGEDLALHAPEIAKSLLQTVKAEPVQIAGKILNVGPARRIAEKAAHIGFQTQMGVGGVEGVMEGIRQRNEAGEWTPEAAEALTQGVLSGAMVAAPTLAKARRRYREAQVGKAGLIAPSTAQPIDALPDALRAEGSTLASEAARRMALNEPLDDLAIPEHLLPHIDALNEQAGAEARDIDAGRRFIAKLRGELGEGQPGVEVLAGDKPENYRVVQRDADGQVVGAAQVDGGAVTFMAGGKRIGLGESIAPLQAKLEELNAQRVGPVGPLGAQGREKAAARISQQLKPAFATEESPALQPMFDAKEIRQAYSGAWHLIDRRGNWDSTPFPTREAAESAMRGVEVPLEPVRFEQAFRGTGDARPDLPAYSRYGPGRYWTDNRRVAEIFAENRDNGRVETGEAALERPFDADRTNVHAPEFRRLVDLLAERGITRAQIQWAMMNDPVDAFAGISKLLPGKGNGWSKAPEFSKLLQQAGYDGISGSTRDLADLPNHSEIVQFAKPDVSYSTESAPETGAPWYSQLRRVVDDSRTQNVATGEQWLRFLSDPKRQVKADEVKWTGLGEFLKSKAGERVTRQQIQEHLDENAVQIREVTKGGPLPDVSYHDWLAARGERTGTPELRAEYDLAASGYGSQTKFQQYSLPGGEGYREVLLTLGRSETAAKFRDQLTQKYGATSDREILTRATPEEIAKWDGLADKRAIPGDFTSQHWDEPNVLAHLRLSDRVDADGKKTLLVEEVQSDWGEKGRKEGFSAGWSPAEVKDNGDGTYDVVQGGRSVRGGLDRLGATHDVEYINRTQRRNDGVAPGPFVTDTGKWVDLGLKRVMKMAADGGYDRVAIVPGEENAKRYDLSKQVDALLYQKNPDGTYRVSAQIPGRGGQMLGESIPAEKLEDHVGKDVAERIVKGEGADSNLGGPGTASQPKDMWKSLSGDGLKVGGEGMRTFYDQIVPQALNKLAKKYGVKVALEGGRVEPGTDYMRSPRRYEGTLPTVETAKALYNRAARPMSNDPQWQKQQAYELWAALERGEDPQGLMDAGSLWLAEQFGGKQEVVPLPGQPVHTLDVPPAMREQIRREGMPLFAKERTAEPTPRLYEPQQVRKLLLDLYPANTHIREGENTWTVTLPNKQTVTWNAGLDRIEVDSSALRAGHGTGELAPGQRIAGRTYSMPSGLVVDIVNGVAEPKAIHENWHVVRALGNLNEKQLRKLERAFPDKKLADGGVLKSEERQADAFGEWFANERRAPNSVFSRIERGIRRVYDFVTQNERQAFREGMETLGRREQAGVALDPHYAVTQTPLDPALESGRAKDAVELRKTPPALQGSGKGGKVTTADVARYLQGEDISHLSDADQIKRMVAQGINEVRYQLKQRRSGVGWYAGDIREMEFAAKKLFPELDDPNQMGLFKSLVAATSLGNRPNPNLEQAFTIWRRFRQTFGEFPAMQESGKNWSGSPVFSETYPKFQKMKERFGSWDGVVDFLRSKTTIGELRKMGFDSVDGPMGEVVYGSRVIGPKATSFFQNLMGNTAELTSDMWFARTFNRWRGTEIIDAPRGPVERRLMRTVIDEIAKKTGLKAADAQAVLWFSEKDLWGKLTGDPDFGTFSIAGRRALESLRQKGDVLEAPSAVGDVAHTVAFEVAFGKDAPRGKEYDWSSLRPEQAAAVTRDFGRWLLEEVEIETGAKVDRSIFSKAWTKTWGENPNAVVRMTGTEGQVRGAARLLGFAAQQDAVVVSSPDANGPSWVAEVVRRGEPGKVQWANMAFLEKVRDEMLGWKKDLFEKHFGFAMDTDGSGNPILKMFSLTPTGDAMLKHPKVSRQLTSRLRDVAIRLDGENPKNIIGRIRRYTLDWLGNDWKEAPDGRQYREALAEDGYSPEGVDSYDARTAAAFRKAWAKHAQRPVVPEAAAEVANPATSQTLDTTGARPPTGRVAGQNVSLPQYSTELEPRDPRIGTPADAFAHPTAQPLAPPEQGPRGWRSPAEIGNPKEPGLEPRVDTKVGELEHLQAQQRRAGVNVPNVNLSRDTVRTWKSLDPEVRDKIGNWDAEGPRILNRIAQKRVISDVEQMALDAVRQGAVESKDAALADYNRAKGTADEQAAHRKYLAQSIEASLYMVGDIEAGTAAGRALAARARVMEAARTGDMKLFRQLMREKTGISARDAEEIVRMWETGDPNLANALRSAWLGKQTWSKFWQGFRANLLGIPSEVANVSSNALMVGVAGGDKRVAVGLDRWLGRSSGVRSRHMSSVHAGEQALLAAAPTAMKNYLYERFVGMYKRAWTGESLPLDPSRPIEHQVTPFKTKAGRLLWQTPLEAMELGDTKLAQPQVMARELAERASEEAIKRTGETSGPVLAAEVRRIMSEVLPSSPHYAPEKHAELIQSAKSASERSLFRDKPGTVLAAALDLRRKVPVLNAVMPFMQTPAKITGMAVAHTPLGFATPEFWRARKAYHEAVKEYHAGRLSEAEAGAAQGQYADILAQRMAGSVLTAGLLALAKTGVLTGAGPSDPKEKQALLATGWQPYSIAVPQKDGTKVYIPYNRFEPVAQVAGIAADVMAMEKAKDANDAITRISGTIASNIIDRTYMRGFMDFSNAMSDPQRYFGTYLTGLTRAAVPRNVVNVAVGLDPTVRDTKPTIAGPLGLLERVIKTTASEIPGVSTFLPERKTATGETAERPGNAITRLLSPIQISGTKPGTELEALMSEIGAVPSAARNQMTINGRKVLLERSDIDLMQRADLAAAAELRKLINTPRFRRLPPTTDEGGNNSQEYLIRATYSRYRERARQALLDNRDFRRRAREQLRQQVARQ